MNRVIVLCKSVTALGMEVDKDYTGNSESTQGLFQAGIQCVLYGGVCFLNTAALC